MLEINGVSKIYGEGNARIAALQNISLKVEKGDSVAIMGPSGSGKSTLLNIIGGLERLSSGEVFLDGKRIDNLDEDALVALRRGKIAYIFQQYHLLPSLSAMENVLLPLLLRGNVNSRKTAINILERVGLGNRIEHKPSELSGGEQQRVAVARALVNNPSLMLADEPTGNLDQKTGRQILDLFSDMNKDGLTIMIVTHDYEIAKHTKNIAHLLDGKIVETKEATND